MARFSFAEQKALNEEHEARIRYLESSIDMLYDRPLEAHARRIEALEKRLKKYIASMQRLTFKNMDRLLEIERMQRKTKKFKDDVEKGFASLHSEIDEMKGPRWHLDGC